MALAAALPAMLVSMVLLWRGDYTAKTQWTLTVVIAGVWLGFAFSLRERIVRPLQTLSNILAALREEDYSIRARGARRDEALGEVMIEVNALGDTLKEHRLGALEATALLRKVMEEIDVAVLAFDGEQRLQLVNRAAERLLAQPSERILGQRAAEMGLQDCLEGDPVRTLQETFPGQPSATFRWRLSEGPEIIIFDHVSRARPASPVAGAVRRQPCPARRRAPGLAASGSGAGP